VDHLQCVAKTTFTSAQGFTRAFKARVIAKFEEVGVAVPRGFRIMSKVLVGRGVHTWRGMKGYVTKDKGQAHYKEYRKNVTDEARAPARVAARCGRDCGAAAFCLRGYCAPGIGGRPGRQVAGWSGGPACATRATRRRHGPRARMHLRTGGGAPLRPRARARRRSRRARPCTWPWAPARSST
jgi:hypothetical protein